MRRVNLKENVYLSGLQPEMLKAVDACAGVFAANRLPLTLTATREPGHGRHSHHYKGLAIDIRIWDIADEVDTYVADIQSALGDDYQVIAESDHIHIEYDPA